MNIDEEFEKWLNSLSEDERKKIEEKLSALSKEELERLKTYIAIAVTFEREKKERVNAILGAINREELVKISKEELVVVLHDVIWQACGDDDGCVDSRAFSAYANAMRLLARLGLLEIESEYGRRVIGKLKVV